MRCPKCGYISFDNVEKCLKCRKNIAAASKLFQGSVLNVTTPVFLKLVPDEEDAGELEIPQDDLQVAEEDFEISDPDLDILLEEEEGGTAEVQLEMDEDLDHSALDQLNDDLSEIEAFTEEDTEEETVPELGGLDEIEMEQAFGEEQLDEELSLEVPDELTDLSDLSPPEKGSEPRKAPAESEVDLDFGDLVEEFGEKAPAAAAGAAAGAGAAAAAPEPKKEKKKTLSLDLDEDLDFDLDLGGLSIHDDDK